MGLEAAAIFQKMAPILAKAGPETVAKVLAVYAFEIRAKKGDKPAVFTVDLKNGGGAIAEGKIEGVKPDATFVMLDSDFVKLVQGKLNAQDAFMQGKMKIRGNMKAALKFKPDIFPQDAKL